jgi:drug/metabolite transporter (DMT)-like permease
MPSSAPEPGIGVPERRRGLSRQELALIGITAIWGTTFLIVHEAMRYAGPFLFVGVRFLTAGIISVLVFRRALRGITWREIGAGAAIGVCIFLGYGLQTAGLQTIPSSTSAFITALYVPFVPLLQWIVFRRPPRLMTLAGIGLAFVGMILLAGPSPTGLTLSPGEWITLAGVVAMAGEIVLIGFFTRTVDLGRLAIVQLLTAGVLGFAAMPVVGERMPPLAWQWILPAIGLGAASCLIQVTMTWAQKTVSPTRATVIYAGEPVWGGIVGRLAGDRLPASALIGAVLIVAGVLVSELRPRRAAAGRDAAEPPHSSLE